jgi:hypothetical protein
MPNWSGRRPHPNNLANYGGRGDQAYRVSNAVNTYIQGIALNLVAIDSQILPDFQTVQPVPAGTTVGKFVGIVGHDWKGFDSQGSLNSSYISVATQLNVRGTQYVLATIKGIEYAWVDQSGSGAVTITDGIPIVSSRSTAGYGQGVALATATNPQAQFGIANLPASGLGSSLTAAALAQASTTFTVGGTPASGDVLTVTLQIPYTDQQPGTAQTHSISVTLNSTTAASTTTAATALAAALNADPYFAVQSVHGAGNPTPYFTASSSSAVVTVAINTLANPFLVTGGTTSSSGTAVEQYRYYAFISGMVANSLTTAASVSSGAGSTLTAAGATFNSGTPGTGYKGKVPILVNGMY